LPSWRVATCHPSNPPIKQRPTCTISVEPVHLLPTCFRQAIGCSFGLTPGLLVVLVKFRDRSALRLPVPVSQLFHCFGPRAGRLCLLGVLRPVTQATPQLSSHPRAAHQWNLSTSCRRALAPGLLLAVHWARLTLARSLLSAVATLCLSRNAPTPPSPYNTLRA